MYESYALLYPLLEAQSDRFDQHNNQTWNYSVKINHLYSGTRTRLLQQKQQTSFPLSSTTEAKISRRLREIKIVGKHAMYLDQPYIRSRKTISHSFTMSLHVNISAVRLIRTLYLLLEHSDRNAISIERYEMALLTKHWACLKIRLIPRRLTNQVIRQSAYPHGFIIGIDDLHSLQTRQPWTK